MIEPLQVTYWIWDAWLVSWVVAAIWSARTTARAPVWSEVSPNVLAFGSGFILLARTAPEAGAGPLLTAVWPTHPTLSLACALLTAVGLGFCWWARIHLGPLWSSAAARKEGHRVIDTGPYRIVRHPIYSGLLLALLAMAFAKGTPAALGLFAFSFLGFWLKARLEERFLRAQLSADYDAYCRRTPMLLPLRIG